MTEPHPLPDDRKDAIITQAKVVCRLVERIDDPRTRHAVEKLKIIIEDATGQTLNNYS